MAKKIVDAVAYFYECNENNYPHGHIVLGDGRQSPPLFSQKEARRLTKQLQWERFVEVDEQHLIYEQIDNSSLPYYPPEEIEEVQKIGDVKLDNDGFREIEVNKDFSKPKPTTDSIREYTIH